MIEQFDITWIDLLRLFVVPVLLPALVGLVNRAAQLPAFAKRTLLAVLALASQLGLEFLAASDAGVAYNLWWALFLGVIAYAVAELSYQGFYKAPLNKPIDAGTARTGEAVSITSLEPPKTISSVLSGPHSGLKG